ncbi:protein NOI4 isoform X1 [Cornus florida]|uniref:protein NOI4 isoform X1 n=1 Tax=Cornus florida TaxID=4283 RepID=UPI0028A1C30E|nr:protein NOI4 isoform X1 [Cornus florida]
MSEKGQPLPKFGEWDVNDPASAEGFTVIFNKARDEKKTGGQPESPGKADPNFKHGVDNVKPQTYLKKYRCICLSRPGGYQILFLRSKLKKWFCCMQIPPAES